ncbi:hypothetical protein [Thalassospira sp.]|uniref:hypothetical protein n=1 Tax=Thalassospira sp. TaxID=1912094 RepID=UPI00273319BC|nr:hypothetical protein [Thalassospira sp.]MDP2696696.1 hypothetical protein [Thalassospira sp.]
MGIFDWPAPAFHLFDSLMAGLIGPFGRVLVWAALCAVISMALYMLLSPQKRIRAVKDDLAASRRALAADDGDDFEAGMALAKKQLAQSLKLVAVVVGPAVAASLPALALIVWLGGQYGYACPASGTSPNITAEPADATVQQVDTTPPLWGEGDCPVVELPAMDAGQTVRVSLDAPIPVLHHREWWNVLIGNPAGYLPDETPVERVEFDLPVQEIIAAGPGWTRTWELTFFAALILVSLGVKKGFRIE